MTLEPRKPTILMVDDDEVLVDLISGELSPHFVVEWARDGGTALASVQRQTPDAIFLDHGLPDGYGVDLIDEFRKAGCDAPVVILTASQDVRVAAAAMRAGAVDFIVKDAVDGFFDDVVPTATRAVEKWNNEKELEYLREQEEQQARRTTELNERLQTKNAQLRRANQAIEASHIQLKNKNRRLSELYETAHRFVDNVSHEMRTPLTVIKEFLSIVLDGLAGQVNEQQREYLLIAMAKTNDLAQMVDDMLDISKIEAGLLRVARVRCRFSDVVSQVRDLLEQKARSCQVTLHIDDPGDLPDVFCDQEKVGRVLINLVVNATKFSDQDIRIWARHRPDPQEVVVGVTDRGPGIAPENLKMIFDRFCQVGDAARSSTKGFGLGLNIVKELVNFNLGEVSVDSEPGRGSTFSFTLPVFDHRALINRFLDRRATFDDHGQHLTLIRAHSTVATAGISSHIQSFVVHSLSPFDLVFERPGHNDVIVVALTNEPQALVSRLATKNREELRRSPGSTVDLSFEILHAWDTAGHRQEIIETFAALFPDVPVEGCDVSQESAHH